MTESKLTTIAHNCPHYNPITSSLLGCSLPRHLQHLSEVSCKSCIYWEDENCSTLQTYQS